MVHTNTFIMCLCTMNQVWFKDWDPSPFLNMITLEEVSW